MTTALRIVQAGVSLSFLALGVFTVLDWIRHRERSRGYLALALGTSQRTVQRALDPLAAAGKAQSFGHGRARRWTTPSVPGFTTTLLLPDPLPSG